MIRNRDRNLSRLLAVFLGASIIAGCGGGGDGDPTGPGGGGANNQTATLQATPLSATIARGGSTSTTVISTITGGLTLSGFNIQRQATGIAVNPVTTDRNGGTTTRVVTFTPDATVPLGAHVIRMWTPVQNYTGNGVVPQPSVEFTLTVTQ